MRRINLTYNIIRKKKKPIEIPIIPVNVVWHICRYVYIFVFTEVFRLQYPEYTLLLCYTIWHYILVYYYKKYLYTRKKKRNRFSCHFSIINIYLRYCKDPVVLNTVVTCTCVYHWHVSRCHSIHGGEIWFDFMGSLAVCRKFYIITTKYGLYTLLRPFPYYLWNTKICILSLIAITAETACICVWCCDRNVYIIFIIINKYTIYYCIMPELEILLAPRHFFFSKNWIYNWIRV